jgi:hypothetical protein
MGDTAKVQALIAAGADLNLQAMVRVFNVRHRKRHFEHRFLPYLVCTKHGFVAQ